MEQILFELPAIQWTNQVLHPLCRYECVVHSIWITCILKETRNILKEPTYGKV